MRRVLYIDSRQFVGLGLALAFALPAWGHGVRKFVNGRWFDGARFIEGKTWWSVEGVLREAHQGVADETIDLHGGYVIPPFAEAHTHDFLLFDPRGRETLVIADEGLPAKGGRGHADCRCRR